jgi:hypothetical protein
MVTGLKFKLRFNRHFILISSVRNADWSMIVADKTNSKLILRNVRTPALTSSPRWSLCCRNPEEYRYMKLETKPVPAASHSTLDLNPNGTN